MSSDGQPGGADPAGLLTTAGIADDIHRLWTPHRMVYLQGEGKPRDDSECPFCLIPTHPDDQSLVVARGELVYVVLNLYPYAAGHLLICPYRHIPSYTDLTSAELTEFGQFTQTAIHTLRESSGCHGFNVGMNLGAVAGAGIAAHLHQHVVPRWGGDSNFMPIIGRTKVLPELLADTRERLAEAWKLAKHRVRRVV